MRSNTIAAIIAAFVIFICLLITQSFAAAVLSIMTLLLGYIFAIIITKTSQQRSALINCLFISFSAYTIVTLVQWLSNEYSFSVWAVDTNDHFRFWSFSEEAVKYYSIGDIFRDCVIDNIYLENGGYIFYLQTLAYLANTFFDGNHIFYQQLGTALPGILTTVFSYSIFSHFVEGEKSRRYALGFILLSPFILESIGVHRDVLIAFFYSVLIYLWLCEKFNIKVFLVQILLAIIVLQLRDQHGLFSFVFIILSILSSDKKSKWLYLIIVVGVVLANFYVISNIIFSNLAETNTYYGVLGADVLSEITTGLGRYVYTLPSPVKEIAIILTSQMHFPPWGGMLAADNLFGLIIGLISTIIYIYWFYVFFVSMVVLFKNKLKQYPMTIILGMIVFFVFLLLNITNMTTRRIVCVYPLLYLFFAYSKEYILNTIEYRRIKISYMRIYSCLCVIYTILSLVI